MTASMPARLTSPAFSAYVAPARGRAQLWRTLLGVILILGIYAGLLALFLLAIDRWYGPGAERLLQARSPVGTVLVLATFLGMALGPVLAVVILHRRRPLTLIGPLRPALRDFCITAGVVLALSLVWMLLPGGPPLERKLDLGLWFQFLPLALLGILVQTGAEELVFRGYLQQQLAARFATPLAWMVLPSVLFGLLHYDPQTMGGNAWLIVAATALFGLIAADLTARTGTLGAAWGLHLANNAVALLFISAEGPLDGLSLWTYPFSQHDVAAMRPLLLLDMAGLVLIWALARRALRR
ncbi:CPBP family intramembrane glutamic endopeptidase [Plastorhodobacter daqingensis]|uniref:CPBP family intramembrane glutamic endopeptidase n=1 Tax=Plastorhodobacter daqingensis TaxID=1387281 RepID=A0ABW2UPC3_9RHOB